MSDRKRIIIRVNELRRVSKSGICLNSDGTAKELRDASGNLPAQRHHPSVVQCEVAYDMFRVFGSASASKKQLFNVSNCVAIRERVVLPAGC